MSVLCVPANIRHMRHDPFLQTASDRYKDFLPTSYLCTRDPVLIGKR
jgi:hypothetical protein